MSELLISEKKDLKKLVELNEELENYFRNTIIPQLFVDADLILRKFSPPANTHFTLIPSDIGKPVDKIPSLEQLPGLRENILEVIKNNSDLEREIQTSDMRWFQMNILPYIIKKQNLTNGVVITFIDITGRINDKQDIEKINADHETFIYSVSHDFRGPVSNLVILAELLKLAVAKNDKEEIKNLTQKIDASAKALKDLIIELTDITKIGADIVHLLTKSNVDKILDEVKFTLKNQIYQSHAKITVNFLVHELSFSNKNLRSILYNLLSNAIKYAAPGRTPEILIKTELREANTLLSVKDNGIGIAEEKQHEIFSKFRRLIPEVEGTGIGLFIVSQMVINQGGKIEVESQLNVGTTFNLYLKN